MPALPKFISAWPARPLRISCFYGVDTPERSKLLAARMDLEPMREFIKADSLAFVSIDGLYRAVGEKPRNAACPQFCDACFTGDYPTSLTDLAAARGSQQQLCVPGGAGRLMTTTARGKTASRWSRGPAKASAPRPPLALAAAGAHVVLTGRDVSALETVEDSIHEAGGASTIAPVDLAESDGIARLASGGRRAGGTGSTSSFCQQPICPPLHRLPRSTGSSSSQALTVNFLATQALLADFDPLLKRADGARVIGLTSSVGADPARLLVGLRIDQGRVRQSARKLRAGGREGSAISASRSSTPARRAPSMRAKAYPGEDPKTVKAPEEVAKRLVELLVNDFEGFHRERVEG